MLHDMTTNSTNTSATVRSSARRETEYWQQTRRPWPSLVFLLPLLVVYEVGVLWIGGRNASAIRSGADELLRLLLDFVGLNAAWWPPLLIVLGLTSWQWAARYPWHVSFETLAGMFVESVLAAFALIVLGQLQSRAFTGTFAIEASLLDLTELKMALTAGQVEFVSRALSFVGAGIYEEVIFRLTLLPLVTAFLRQTVLPRAWAPALAALVTSVLFAAAHHVGPAGEPFELFPFCFRMLAGVFFAALFVLRGFGIAVGSHAIYDLLVGVLFGS